MHGAGSSPENGGVANVLGLQGHALQELIAEAVVKGAVETWGAAVRLQHSKALHLVVTVYEKLCFVAVDTHQHHVLQCPTHVAANQLVGDAICESLPKQGEEKSDDSCDTDANIQEGCINHSPSSLKHFIMRM